MTTVTVAARTALITCLKPLSDYLHNRYDGARLDGAGEAGVGASEWRGNLVAIDETIKNLEAALDAEADQAPAVDPALTEREVTYQLDYRRLTGASEFKWRSENWTPTPCPAAIRSGAAADNDAATALALAAEKEGWPDGTELRLTRTTVTKEVIGTAGPIEDPVRLATRRLAQAMHTGSSLATPGMYDDIATVLAALQGKS